MVIKQWKRLQRQYTQSWWAESVKRQEKPPSGILLDCPPPKKKTTNKFLLKGNIYIYIYSSSRRGHTHPQNWEQTVSYPTSEGETVVELQQAHGQFRSNHMLQVNLIPLKHGIRILGAPPNINPVIDKIKFSIQLLENTCRATASFYVHSFAYSPRKPKSLITISSDLGILIRSYTIH